MSQEVWDGREGCVAMDIVAGSLLHQSVVDQLGPISAAQIKRTLTIGDGFTMSINFW